MRGWQQAVLALGLVVVGIALSAWLLKEGESAAIQASNRAAPELPDPVTPAEPPRSTVERSVSAVTGSKGDSSRPAIMEVSEAETQFLQGYVDVHVVRGGRDLAGCRVTLMRDEVALQTGSTDSEGRLRFEPLLHRLHSVVCRWNGQELEKHVVQNQSMTIEWPEDPGLSLVILDHRNAPVAGARVASWPQHTDSPLIGHGSTDRDGVVKVLIAEYPVMILASRGPAAGIHFLERPPAAEPITLTLAEPTHLHGRVCDLRGTPITGASVSFGRPKVFTRSGDQGEFELAATPAGPRRLRIEASGFASATFRWSAALVPGETLELGTVLLADSVPVGLRITDRDGHPLVGACVDLEPQGPPVPTTGSSVLLRYGEPLRSAFTDTEGRARFEVPRGTWTARVRCPGYRWASAVVACTEPREHTMVLEPACELTVRVVPDEGSLGDARWRLNLTAFDPATAAERRGPAADFVRTGADTWAAFGLGPGRYRVEVSSDRFSGGSEEVVLEQEDREIVVMVRQGQSVHGQVQFHGRPVPMADVYARVPDTEDWWDTSCDEDGRFELIGVPLWDGRCVIQAHAELEGRHWWSRSAPIGNAEDCLLELTQRSER